jgi:hypothetical protein
MNEPELAQLPKVYCFISSRWGDDLAAMAVGEDGVVLAQHVSSSLSWAKHDIGHEGVSGSGPGTVNRGRFGEHFPAGYETEWVDDPANHAGLQGAFEKDGGSPG